MENAIRISIVSMLFPLVAFGASFERDLYFGILNDPDVTRLQEFLRDQGVYTGPVTGNFFTMTQEGVKRFQERESIKPAFGYFGPKTRARANAPSLTVASADASAQSREALIASLAARIQALQEELLKLQKPVGAEEAVSPISPTVPSTPAEGNPVGVSAGTSDNAPVPFSGLRITGNETRIFPDFVTTPLKLGEFTIYNGSTTEISLIRFEVDIIDGMDSFQNRSKKVYILLRDGVAFSDLEISKTSFTFHSKDPTVLSVPHSARLGLPYSRSIKQGETKTVSVWIELFEFVRGGTLEIKQADILMVPPADITGLFDFLLTK
ncbi:MAG: hypothetical protein A3C07_04835 [Candidatus Sungbacteria bacterium RIFCSPHIGHO2_02_FULL_47_11]|uniref:Peptidoglycan binding-like domain-containing protein n=1 Tax=Candidatus Sungbacteria bacterium RIFCSPHIGHO2_02_FULL_47_11 TaxID=1802270 RepID=A0A1G2KJJ2_9BACT|nr:MAG: hypothetical protein A3C07_04835 [Candidatus Sungbacteria bacterium RIFCSPHIGHO2_02_FULL_47_11]